MKRFAALLSMLLLLQPTLAGAGRACGTGDGPASAGTGTARAHAAMTGGGCAMEQGAPGRAASARSDGTECLTSDATSPCNIPHSVPGGCGAMSSCVAGVMIASHAPGSISRTLSTGAPVLSAELPESVVLFPESPPPRA